jgi:hypothetical protein
VWRDKYGTWYSQPASTGGDTSFWGRLTHKTHGECPEYRYVRLTPSANCSAALGERTPLIVGSCMEVNGVDLPVPEQTGEQDTGTGTGTGTGTVVEGDPVPFGVIARLYPVSAAADVSGTGTGTGTGTEQDEGPFCLFEMTPRTEIVRALGLPDEEGYIPGLMLDWGTNGKPEGGRFVWIYDTNAGA